MSNRSELTNNLRSAKLAAGDALDVAEALHADGQLSKSDLKRVSALYGRLMKLTEHFKK